MSDFDLLEALPVAVYTTDAEGRITSYNTAAVDLWGRRPQIGSDSWCGSWRLFWPDGRPLTLDECPMAMALKEGRPIRGIEAVAERPDGSRVRFLPFPTPLRDATGKITGAVNLLMELTERDRAEALSARLAAIVASSDDAIVSKTLDGRITSWNVGAERIFGYQESEMIGQPITRIIPAELLDEEKDIIARLRRGERISHFETVRVAKDGRRVDISLTVSPLHNRLGNVVGASKVARDISERKRADSMQRLLIEELQHRVKNTLATIQAIASQSLTRARNPQDFVTGFSGRLAALARAHDLLTRTRFEGAEVTQLIREQVLLTDAADAGSLRIRCSGPELMLDAQTALQLSLVLHELATNARKHGALSVPTGRLLVEWEIHSNGGRSLVLEWTERDGPPVTAPTEHGFGTTLISQTMKAHGGTASIRYAKDGLTGVLSLPLSEQARPSYASGSLTKEEAAMPVQPSRSNLKGKRIIVIEDEPLVAMEMESILTDAGCQLAGSAGNFDEAKRLCANAACDVALVDANLRGQAVDELALTLTTRNIPFAFVTGYGREALPHGFRDAIMLKKPFRPEDLFAAVEVLTHRAPGVIELRRKEV
jgi:PAS domain S-box-containing protein